MKSVYLQLVCVMIVLSLGIVACESQAGAKENQVLPPPESIGNPTNGALIFGEWHGEAPACSFCHVVEGTSSKTGPSLDGIASMAGKRVSGLDAVDYLRESILDPSAYIADGKDKSRMYKHFGDVFNDEEINDIIAYLITLE